MSRDIKFRAYVEKINKIVNVDKINFEDKHIVHYLDNLPFPTLVKYSFEDIVLMQYVGMKDKNNKEIYDGDILKVKGIDWLYIVKFYDCCFIGVSKYDPHYEKPIFIRDTFLNGIEVIGNIYENPELLKGEK